MRECYTSKVFSKPPCLTAKKIGKICTVKEAINRTPRQGSNQPLAWCTVYSVSNRFLQFYFCNQTRRLRENFRGIALSHSLTGLGSTNNLSWKSKHRKPRGAKTYFGECIICDFRFPQFFLNFMPKENSCAFQGTSLQIKGMQI